MAPKCYQVHQVKLAGAWVDPPAGPWGGSAFRFPIAARSHPTPSMVTMRAFPNGTPWPGWVMDSMVWLLACHSVYPFHLKPQASALLLSLEPCRGLGGVPGFGVEASMHPSPAGPPIVLGDITQVSGPQSVRLWFLQRLGRSPVPLNVPLLCGGESIRSAEGWSGGGWGTTGLVE